MNRKYVVVAAVLLIILVSISLFLILKPEARQFYLGVEYAYGGQFSQVKALVDKVKSYTNLFVLGSVLLTFNRTALDESCNYIYSSGLSFIVLVTSYLMYNVTNGYPGNNNLFDWIGNATQLYGSKLLGIYRYDEPGGHQLDDAASRLISNSSLSYQQIADEYVSTLSGFTDFYGTIGNRTTSHVLKIFTSDYGLYWFDYQGGYSTVFAEFVGNQSRQGIVALERGAAQSFNRPWGIIINWKYDQAPYLESPAEMFSDLSLAYSAGATYEVIFSFPNITAYGTLTQADFDTLQMFWNDVHSNPGQFGSSPAQAAYVLPAYYGFGFRSADDTIWGLFPADNDTYTAKIWNDTQLLLAKYYGKLNIIFDYPDTIDPTLGNYTTVYYYNQTITA